MWLWLGLGLGVGVELAHAPGELCQPEAQVHFQRRLHAATAPTTTAASTTPRTAASSGASSAASSGAMGGGDARAVAKREVQEQPAARVLRLVRVKG